MCCLSLAADTIAQCHAPFVLDASRDISIRYKYHLALIVVVDKENHTQLAMQAVIQRERTEDFKLLFESFKEMCNGHSPQVKTWSKVLTNGERQAQVGQPRKGEGHEKPV